MAVVRIEVSEQHIAFIIRMKIISEIGTTIAVTSNSSRLRKSTSSDSSHRDDGGDPFLRKFYSYKSYTESRPGVAFIKCQVL
jgi:hypothetical protein